MAESWETTPLETGPAETGDTQPRRRPDLGALIPGLLFIALAILLMSPADLPRELFDGVLVWAAVVIAGVALLVSELRRGRRRRR
ncbi:hypothetical protein [Candidatus Blastococcus massiliensis]|uniref:hypothetical protein n=1 Tax=Candidatus Blastococcus massiliensis TaxID=1470358 RepID=UPI0004B2B8D0|nr:hypothetical protein [Candidatus Blastococcus massiliensis]